MGELVSGLLAILSGGATGLLGIIAQRIFDHWKLKQELDQMRERHRHEVDMKKVDAEIMREEWAQRVKIAQEEGATARDVADSQAFAASLTSEPKRYSDGVKPGKVGGFLLILVDVLRGIVRPGLTIYLGWIATALYLDSQAVMRTAQINGDKVVNLHQQIVLTLLYLFTTCVLWYFGTRNKGQQPRLA